MGSKAGYQKELKIGEIVFLIWSQLLNNKNPMKMGELKFYI